MTKKYISVICNLYINNDMAVSTISRRKNIPYSFYRIKRLIKYLNKLQEQPGGLPLLYKEILFKKINEKQLIKEECNNFIIKNLAKWFWKEKRVMTCKKASSEVK